MFSKRYIVAFILAGAALACGSDGTPSTAPQPQPQPDPHPLVLLKDIVIPLLPSPYYHFAYDPTGRIASASFASGLTMYTLSYVDGRLSAMQNGTLGNQDRLVYHYDGAGNVAQVDYVSSSGVFTQVRLSYDGAKLVGLERQRKTATGFVVDKTMTMAYGADGNLSDVTEHRPAIDGVQPATTTNDHFANYDAGLNVDSFGLLHQEFFDHLILLPRVQLQKNNPRHITHSGDGDNYVVDYTYLYDGENRPLSQAGVLTYTTGTQSGRQFNVGSTYSYY
jgi:hypothetical protein